MGKQVHGAHAGRHHLRTLPPGPTLSLYRMFELSTALVGAYAVPVPHLAFSLAGTVPHLAFVPPLPVPHLAFVLAVAILHVVFVLASLYRMFELSTAGARASDGSVPHVLALVAAYAATVPHVSAQYRTRRSTHSLCTACCLVLALPVPHVLAQYHRNKSLW
eukprot:3850110-Rhodomonas_salina.1